jgi:hypothetical protein
MSLYVTLIKSTTKLFLGLIKHHAINTNGAVEVQLRRS